MDAYQVLGLSRGCSLDEAHAAFRAQAANAHPDTGGTNSTFIELRAAYETILADLNRKDVLDGSRPVRRNSDRPNNSDNKFGLDLYDSSRATQSLPDHETYRAMVSRIARKGKPEPSPRAGLFGLVMIVHVFVASCLLILTLEGKQENEVRRFDAERKASALDSDRLIAVNVVSFPLACMIVYVPLLLKRLIDPYR